jgi:hypothetical protein
MKRALVVLAAAALCSLAVGVGSASALNYVCYWGSDVSRTTSISDPQITLTSTVSYQYGFNCNGAVVVIKTKTINVTANFKVGASYTQHTLGGGSLNSNGQAYYTLTNKQATCYAVCTVSLSWQPYVSVNYVASNYSWHGGIGNYGLSGVCQFDHFYNPGNNITTDCTAPH